MNNLTISTKEEKKFVGSTSESILDSALKAGLIFEYSCKTGQCGVCKMTVSAGEVTELQTQLALSEKDRLEHKILSCCCSPSTDILIEAEDLAALHGINIKTLPCRINKINRFSDNLMSVTLRLPPTANFKFLEGQYIDVIGPNSVRRSYSIASNVNQKEVTLFIKEFVNGVMSNYWFNEAKENDLLRIEGPKGTFFLRDTYKDLLFLATGTGIAPIHSILSALDESDNYTQRGKINLYWGNRYPEEFFWVPKFKNLQVDVNYVLSRDSIGWQYQKGYIQDVALRQMKNISQTTVYACGSNAMIQSAHEAFSFAGLADSHFHSDAFVQSY